VWLLVFATASPATAATARPAIAAINSATARGLRRGALGPSALLGDRVIWLPSRFVDAAPPLKTHPSANPSRDGWPRHAARLAGPVFRRCLGGRAASERRAGMGRVGSLRCGPNVTRCAFRFDRVTFGPARGPFVTRSKRDGGYVTFGPAQAARPDPSQRSFPTQMLPRSSTGRHPRPPWRGKTMRDCRTLGTQRPTPRRLCACTVGGTSNLADPHCPARERVTMVPGPCVASRSLPWRS
jgi:hypothetical protein